MKTCARTEVTLDDLEVLAFEQHGTILRHACSICGGDRYELKATIDGRDTNLVAHVPAGGDSEREEEARRPRRKRAAHIVTATVTVVGFIILPFFLWVAALICVALVAALAIVAELHDRNIALYAEQLSLEAERDSLQDELDRLRATHHQCGRRTTNFVLRATEGRWSRMVKNEHAARLQSLIERVSYRNATYYFRVGLTPGMKYPFVQIAHLRPDSTTGEQGWGFGGKAYISEHVTDSEVFQTLFGLAKAYEEHEVREFFLVDGKRPFGPHIDTVALCGVADRLDARPAAGVE